MDNNYDLYAKLLDNYKNELFECNLTSSVSKFIQLLNLQTMSL